MLVFRPYDPCVSPDTVGVTQSRSYVSTVAVRCAQRFRRFTNGVATGITAFAWYQRDGLNL